MTIEIKSDKAGTIRYFKDGRFHREDGPAVIEDDIKMWYINGVFMKTTYGDL